MRFQSLIPLLAVASTAVADTTKTLSACRTGLGTTSKAKVGTTSYALTLTFKTYKTLTSTPSTTQTPKAVSVTVTQTTLQTTTTTLASYTPTVTLATDQSVYSTIIITAAPATSTSTLVSTTTILTATIPTADGFLPIRSAYPNAKRAVPEQRKPKERRGRIDIRAAAKKLCSFNGHSKPVYSPALYPTGVTCGALVNVIKTSSITKVGSKTSTLTAATPTSTAIVLTTSTITATYQPTAAQVTIYTPNLVTIWVTQTQTPTITVATTTTTTAGTPIATVYAACQPDNFLVGINGAGISFVGLDSPLDFAYSGAGSSSDCCIACQTSVDCYGFYFAGGECTLIINDAGTCTSMPGAETFGVNAGIAEGYVTLGNGPCGQLVAQGS